MTWLRDNEVIAIWLEGIALVAILVVDLKQRIEERSERREQHKETAEQLDVALKQAEAAKTSADALINSERAWILVDTGEIPDDFQANENSVGILDVRSIVRNTGKTPGWITKGFIRYFLLSPEGQLPPEPDYSGNMAQVQVNIVLAPNGLIQPLHVSVPVSTFAGVRQGNQRLYVYGFVHYTILPNQTRQRRFCFEYHVPHGFDPQVRGFYMSVDLPAACTQCP